MCFHFLNKTISQQSTTNTEQKLWLLMCKRQCIRSFPEQGEPLLLILWKLSLSQLLIIIHVSLNFWIIGEWPILLFHSFYLLLDEFYNKNDNPSPRIKKKTKHKMTWVHYEWTSELYMGLIKTPSDTPWYSSLVQACFYSFMLTYSLIHE